ncbi:coiled-coil domain-containing protein 134 isoform X2 [Parasteatoda tepidariorum]|uniref:coiled-coil domain-containing protein 134 isoform X2 n=1 Tax=Parasteatoda tepidariorum TaxID=114398 RepID=UPI001C7215D2|nr:coiled-coil domain-containing protein 134 isoform X2 [Parasteatoda tepidariorum]
MTEGILNSLHNRLLVLFKLCIVFYLYILITFAQYSANDVDSLKKEKTTMESIFKAAFLETRIHQIEALQSVLKFQDYEKQYKITYKALEKIYEVIASSKVIVENSNYIPGFALPVNISVYEALGKIIDNTAMFGEFRLKLPDITERIMDNHQDWHILMKWAIGFSNSTGVFDNKTVKMINLLCQEMNLIPREDNFINPYRKYNSKNETLRGK